MTNGYWLFTTDEFVLEKTVKVYLAEHIFRNWNLVGR